MSDIIEVRVGRERISKFNNIDLNDSFWEPEGDFSIEVPFSVEASTGEKIEFWINGVLEFTGIILTKKRTKKRGQFRSSILTGKSLVWVLIASCVTEFTKTYPTTLPELVSALVKPLPFLKKKDFFFRDGSDKVVIKKKVLQCSPGDTVFSILKRAVNSQGFVFWTEPNGSFIIGKATRYSTPDYAILDQYESCELSESIENRHSKIIVMGESQDDSDIKYVAKTREIDYPFDCPYVLTWNEEEGSATSMVDLQVQAEELEAESLTYSFSGFSQNGITWRNNAFARITDEDMGVNGYYRVTSRNFRLSKREKASRIVFQRGGQ